MGGFNIKDTIGAELQKADQLKKRGNTGNSGDYQ